MKSMAEAEDLIALALSQNVHRMGPVCMIHKFCMHTSSADRQTHTHTHTHTSMHAHAQTHTQTHTRRHRNSFEPVPYFTAPMGSIAGIPLIFHNMLTVQRVSQGGIELESMAPLLKRCQMMKNTEHVETFIMLNVCHCYIAPILPLYWKTRREKYIRDCFCLPFKWNIPSHRPHPRVRGCS